MDSKKLIRSAGVVGIFTMLSRLLGLFRDILMGAFFGTSVQMSAFVIAFTIPNLFRRLFGEGALASSFIPIFIETREKESPEAAWTMAHRVFSWAIVAFSGIVTLGLIVSFIGSSLDVFDEKWRMIFALSRVMFPYMMFICLAALCMAVLNSLHCFKISSFTPSILNICWIGTIVLVCPFLANSPEPRIYAIAWAVLFAGVLQMVVQVPTMIKLGFKPRFDLCRDDKRIHKMLLMMGPAAFGLAVTQLNVVVDRTLAMWVGDYAPAALFYAERLVYFPLGVIATALGTVLLPAFSGFATRGEFKEMRDSAERSIRHLIFIMLPATVGLASLANLIFSAFFEQGAFDANSTKMSAIALQCYAPGLIIFSLYKVVVPAFYSMQDTKTPVKIGMIALGINFLLNITFIIILPAPYKHAGIALGTVLAEAFSSMILFKILQKRIGRISFKEIAKTSIRSTLAAVAMFATILILMKFLKPMLSSSDKIGDFVLLGSCIGAGGLSYFVVSILSKSPEIREILSAIRRKKQRKSAE